MPGGVSAAGDVTDEDLAGAEGVSGRAAVRRLGHPLAGPLEHVECVSTTSVPIELDQPLVADPEVMRDLVEHDVPELAA